MNNKYDKEINAVSDEISQRGDLWELYYQRGYLYYLNDEDEKAADDYRHAVSLGLDYIETPYYTFSNFAFDFTDEALISAVKLHLTYVESIFGVL